MKSMIGIFYMFLIGNMCIGQVQWGPEIDVANSLDNKRPRVVLSNGNPVVMWGQEMGVNGVVHSAVWNGNSFDTPQQVNPSGVDAFATWWAGPSIAAKDSVVFIVFEAQPEQTEAVYIVKSTDGGATYGDTVAIDNPSDLTRFSSVAIDNNYNPVVMFMTHQANWLDPEYSIVKSADGGLTWGAAVQASQTGAEVCDCCPGHIMMNNNNITTVFRNNDNNIRDIWISNSADGGLTFPTQIDIDNNDWLIGACPSSGPDAYYNGDTVLSVWMSSGSGDTRVYIGGYDLFSGSTMNAKALDPTTQPSTIQNFPRIDGVGQEFGVAYQNTSSGNHDIHFTYSLSGSNGVVDTTYRVNSDPTGAQRNVDIAFDGVDTYHIVWQDDPSGNVKYRTATITGVNNLYENKENKLELYPNPSEDFVAVNAPGVIGGTINILGIDGKLLYSNSFSSSEKLDFSNFYPGTYIINVVSSEGNINLYNKVIVK